MSLYADYLRERTDDCIVETEHGFATYRFLPNDTVYIIDIYVVPEMRRKHYASNLADEIVRLAKARGCKRVIGTVVASAHGSDNSIKTLQGYGMKLQSHDASCIVFGKDI